MSRQNRRSVPRAEIRLLTNGGALTTSGIWGIAIAVAWELNARQSAMMADRSGLTISSVVPIEDAVSLCQRQRVH